MRSSQRIWLLAAAALIAIGVLLFTVGMAANHWEFSKLDTVKHETYDYEIGEAFQNIAIHTRTADIRFAVSETGCKVVCEDDETLRHSVEVRNGTLTINAAEIRQCGAPFGIYITSPKLTVYLPEAQYASLRIQESTGSIEIPAEFRFEEAYLSLSTGDVNFSASVRGDTEIRTSTGGIHVKSTDVGSLTLSVTTGEVTVSDVNCKCLESSGSTGDILLKNVNAEEKITIERSTGDVRLDASDAAALSVKTGTGSVSGTLLSDKIFLTQSASGSVRVPKTTTGGSCEITTSTGDIELEIAGA